MGHDTLDFVRGIGAIGVVVAVASCNYDWTFRPDGGTTLPDKDAGSDPNVPGNDSGTPQPGTCARDKQECPPGEYCHFADRTCGTSTTIGECRKSAADCKNVTACGCDGTAVTDCDAQKKGIDTDESGVTCKSGSFACGKTQCKLAAQACLTKTGGEPLCIDDCAKCPCDAYASCKCEETTPGAVSVTCF